MPPSCPTSKGQVRHEKSSFPDFNGDDIVDVNDLLILIADWGTCTDNCNSDVNDDGEVDVNDLLILIAAWGPCE